MSTAKKKRFFSKDEKSVNAIREQFLKVNKGRLNLVRDTLKNRQRVFLDILPLLFHYNDAQLPGFSGDHCPSGIYDFVASKEHTTAARSLVKTYTDRRKPLREYHIYALYLIGSTGTIAYTDSSDLDIWVCHRSDLEPEAIEVLQKKCDSLTNWANSINLDANFFVLTPESIREGHIENLSDESSGSAQHQLLIEEFYRSGLHLCGRIPAWWLVPPDQENKYYQHLEMLLSKKIIDKSDIIDFGDISTITPAEYYGAALWQLNKAITSPYKSILKLLLMETYASEFPDTELLCTHLKRAIYDGETNIDNLDSYVLLINKLDKYLSSSNSSERLELARRCFYFKVNEWLTNKQQGRTRTHEIMTELTTRWQWTRDDLLLLDSRQNWKIDRVLEERRILVNELTLSYRKLTDTARQHTLETNITEQDLNVLGRRLYTTFERKAGKVDLINPGISIDVSEPQLCFVYLLSNGSPTWLLLRNDYDSTRKDKQKPIKRTHSLIEMVSWCHFNCLIGKKSVVKLQNLIGGYTSQDLLHLIDTFKERFPGGYVPKASVQQLSEPAYISSSAIFINVGQDPMSEHTKRGYQLTTNRSDALCYGGQWQNLIKTCSSIVVTSWGEIITTQYDGENSLIDCVTEYLSWTSTDNQNIPETPRLYCYTLSNGDSISRRIQRLFDDLILYFYKSSNTESGRYFLAIEHKHILLALENNVPRYEILDTKNDLIQAMSRSQDDFSPYLFDRHCIEHKILKLLQRYNRTNVIQLYYYHTNNQAEIYVLDELGSLYTQVIDVYDMAASLGHYQMFFNAALKRRSMQSMGNIDLTTNISYQFVAIKKSVSSGYYLDSKNKPKISTKQSYFDLQVIGDILNLNDDAFYLYCNGTEFSNLEYGKNVLKEAVLHILSKRNEGSRYPIYITDIDIQQSSLQNDQSIQTSTLLNYKKQIEQKLNYTLKSIQ